MIRIFAKAASFSALGAKGQILNLINPSLGIKTSMDEGKPIENLIDGDPSTWFQ